MVKVFDIENLANCFTLTAVPAVEGDDTVEKFVIHELWDDRVELFKWLKTPGLKLVGFNNLKFDYPVLHRILMSEQQLMWMNPDAAARTIYRMAQDVLYQERPEVKWREVRIPQCDIYRIHHFDNKAKHASLKWIQIGMKWKTFRTCQFIIGAKYRLLMKLK